MDKKCYQVALLGAADSREFRVREAVHARVTDLGLDADVIQFLRDQEVSSRNPRLPLMAIFFGAEAVAKDSALITELIGESAVIAPVVSSLQRLDQELPPQLRHIQALDFSLQGLGVERLASLVLETFRLLRMERRLFISYRRAEAQPLANLLYDGLDARGFDVFIDTRSIPPAVDFQAELWHRMSDSDVVIIIDTPGFRARRWTAEEMARANATNIQILHLLWPGQREDSASAFSHFLALRRSDFGWGLPGKGGRVRQNTLRRIYAETERLRARAIAARHRYLIDNFCDAARDLGMNPEVQPERWVALPRANGRPLAIVPAVGVPTSDRLNAMFDSIAGSGTASRDVWVVYDNRGVLSHWLAHLDWLDTHLPVRTIRMSHAPAILKTLLP